MSIKKQFAIYFSILFSAILAVVLLLVLFLFMRFRKEEFRMRLEEKALSTVELLVDAKVSEMHVLNVIDKGAVDKLYNDKIMVFDESMKLIYSNIGGTTVNYSISELRNIKKKGYLFTSEGVFDKFSMYYDSSQKDYYVIVAAEDKYGNMQLWYLRYLLLGAFIAGTVSVILLSYSLSAKIFSVLEKFQKRIIGISEKKLHVRLEESGKKDEIDQLAHAFNNMMDRIYESYKQQKEFTDNASHELRTPITRIMMQVQNLIKNEDHSENSLRYLQSIMNDTNQMSDIISSLLLLSRIDKNDTISYLPPCRLDEVIFDAIEFISKSFPDCSINFNIENQSNNDINVEVKGDANLLKIVFVNLLKNAYQYSPDKKVDITMKQQDDVLNIEFVNKGKSLNEDDKQNIFKAFTRGSNAQNVPGTGLGLRIAERIVNYHKAQIQYIAPNDFTNCFVVSFKF